MSPAALSYIARHARGPLMRSQPDHRLVALVRSGSEPAFEALVARYRDPLLRYCRRILSADRAEDAVQQTFVNAHAAIVAGRGGDDLRPWLYRIAHNAAVDQLRHRGPDEPLCEELPSGDLPEEIVNQRERLADVLAALEDLPPRQRDALLLRELEGRSYEEIAFALGVGDGAVRQLLNRARNTMRSAAATVVPPAVLRWAPDHVGRTAEVAGGAGATTVAAKTWVGALIAAASVGGVVAVPIVTDDAHRPAPSQPRQAAPVTKRPDAPVPVAEVVAPAAPRPDAPQPSAGRVEHPAAAPIAPEPEHHPRVEHRSDPVEEEPSDDSLDETPEPVDDSHEGGEEASDAGDDHHAEVDSGGEDPPEVAAPDEGLDD